MTVVELKPEVAADPNAVPPANIESDGKRASVVPAEVGATEERPTWLPQKFATPEAMAEAYAALEKKQATPPSLVVKEPAPTGEVKETPKGADFSALLKDYSENGEVSEATFTALAKQGVTKEHAQTYLDGQISQAAARTAAVAKAVGGEERLQEMLTWAETGLSADEAKAYNEIAVSGNVMAISLAAAGLVARMDADQGTDPKLIKGEVQGTGGLKPFASRAEVVEAMRNPKYKNDPAYRKVVEQRLGASDVFGI